MVGIYDLYFIFGEKEDGEEGDLNLGELSTSD